MKPKSRQILGIMLPAMAVGVFSLIFLGKSVGTLWLSSHSTVYLLERPPGFQLSIAVHRYPRLAHFPEYLGFGEGFVQLFDRETGKVFEDVNVEDLGSVNTFAWGALTVTVGGVGELRYPESYRYPSSHVLMDGPRDITEEILRRAKAVRGR